VVFGRSVVKIMMHDVFSIAKPAAAIPLVFDSPHSGAEYPQDFEYVCDFLRLRRAEDSYVDELFSSAPEHGAPLLKAHFPRSYIDVNRAIDDIDPAILDGDWPYGAINPTVRSDSGIGLIRRLVAPGKPLYDAPLAPEIVKNRIDAYYRPYHKALEGLLDEAHYNFGHVYHLNCHSMPNSTAFPKRITAMVGNQIKPSDFVLSNRDGTTSGTDFMHSMRDILQDMGYRVSLNDPFKGVELVQRYSRPSRGRHSVQIEVNKSLYMDEDTCERSGGFDSIRSDIEQFVAATARYVSAQGVELAAD